MNKLDVSEDKPTIDKCGTQIWYKDGKRHRADGPAFIGANGNQSWYKDGNLHRDGDKPAYIGASGTQIWYKDGKFHRDGDLPAYVWADGSQEWWKDGKRHRTLGPAYIEYPIYEPNYTVYEWWIEGVRYTEEEFKLKISRAHRYFQSAPISKETLDQIAKTQEALATGYSSPASQHQRLVAITEFMKEAKDGVKIKVPTLHPYSLLNALTDIRDLVVVLLKLPAGLVKNEGLNTLINKITYLNTRWSPDNHPELKKYWTDINLHIAILNNKGHT